MNNVLNYSIKGNGDELYRSHFCANSYFIAFDAIIRNKIYYMNLVEGFNSFKYFIKSFRDKSLYKLLFLYMQNEI